MFKQELSPKLTGRQNVMTIDYLERLVAADIGRYRQGPQ